MSGKAATASAARLTVGIGQQLSSSVVNTFRVTAVAERLSLHMQTFQHKNPQEFFSLCLSLARGIDYAVANNDVPPNVQSLPRLLTEVCKHGNNLFLGAGIMVLMISVKNACARGWFSEKESQELCALANEIGGIFCSLGGLNNEPSNYSSIIATIMSRFYPFMTMGHIIAFLEVKPGYEGYIKDFHISKDVSHSPEEKIRLFVAQTDNIETSACIINPQEVSFLFNGKGVDRRTTALMDSGPQLPTNVTSMLKYGTNLLQAVGQFKGHYIIAVAFMSVTPSSESPLLLDYVQSDVTEPDPDSDIIEGPSRISLNCPISCTRIRTPIKGHSCKHLQCFDFSNFVKINSRKPSWRCPHCNQHVCYTDIRKDQNMVKVLKEVGDNVIDVIMSYDGSWKAVLESDDDTYKAPSTYSDCQKEKTGGGECTTSAALPPIVLDLTVDNDKMDTVAFREIEERKPSQASLQNQPISNDLTMNSLMTDANFNENIGTQLHDNFWASLLNACSEASPTRTGAQIFDGISQPMPSPITSHILSDAISPALIHDGGVHSNLVLNEYAGPSQIPRHINRTPVAIQALPVPFRTSAPPPRTALASSFTSASSLSSPGVTTPAAPTASGFNTTSSDTRQHQFPSYTIPHQMSYTNPPALQHQQMAQGPSAQPQVLQTSNQFSGGSRLSSGSQNMYQQQAFHMPQSRGQSPTIRSTHPLQRVQAQHGANVAVGTTSSHSQQPRVIAAHRPNQMARQPPVVSVQIPATRVGTPLPAHPNMIRSPITEQGTNVPVVQTQPSGADGLVDLSSEQNWRPTGRMRGSLTGRPYSAALRELMIQPTSEAQPSTQPSNLTAPPSGVSPALQAFLAKSRNTKVRCTENGPVD
ncbi:hypothetical protein K2173_022570 [Erythroxylum novogranatense]|uniref:SP-RING-type domain-containing protein n=1 Tax=Erythroxylum novogranatense TaxID=1862640 RepID=A0AAV8TPU8_9ROSI|nr:hypothetical protein K2173_022570 [Erythroxylum novogranatense]